MIRNHGFAAERRAVERADKVEAGNSEAAKHWREVARAVRMLQRQSRLP
jgi:hypothetical protein